MNLAFDPPSFGRFEWLREPPASLDLLIVAPHPDDEVLGPGGLALLQAELGDGVGVAILTDGARGAGGVSEPGLAERREQESLAGLRLLRSHFAWFARLSSKEVCTHPGGLVAAGLISLFRATTPRVVAVTAPFERHTTHKACTRAALTALRRARLEPQPRLLGYGCWDPIPGDDRVEAVDISAVLERKLEALRCHESQLQVRPFDEAARGRHRAEALLSATTGSHTAEYVERYLDMSDLLQQPELTLHRWVLDRFTTLYPIETQADR